MKIGKATVPQSAICAHNPDTIVVRGEDLCQDLIGQLGFGDYFYLLLTGKRPDAPASAVLNATLVAIAEHGLVPSVQAARMTLAAAPDALQGAVAAGILGCGSVILGASETAGRLFDQIHREGPKHGDDLKAAARAVVGEWRARGQAVPGYGHPVHKARDPRVAALFRVSKQAGGGQRYVEIAEAVEQVLPEVIGKDLRLNVSAAIPAVLLGVGFPLNALKGVPMLARCAGLIAHMSEELEQPIGFALSYQATLEQRYTGHVPAGFVPVQKID
ncbi:MAG: citryl-CoA lyase [Hydrogenophaga sp.]|uniref:citryl-CoA lyase n=1 Tax=Hydrogenophaga sp. TaxID=1904254 RepID=UPI0016A797E2|nr:citryl-CoA lyase [Hydrogenophaga sp.]NIM41184.1 citryl-CoA lyase [Hydrogenophaga sp.]NIN26500.1 citryl-CoA lyase [Hydrogenophaga sp.]NIN31375.1 citryl-CoA lyase [Hydrogenophaga sp.]NIN55430.1 citryl-CoA lyase [Hydrogenophaga sp.]NIO51765.1 citryl-CoA lyase [Hydrogenophaga sp.]